MPTKKLTPGFCLNPDPPAKGDKIIYWDTAVVGLGLCVTNTNHKSWVVTYRTQAQEQRRMSLKGVLTLAEARKEAKVKLADVAKGGDPLTEKRKAASATSNTLKAVAEEYLKREAIKLRTHGERSRVFGKLIYPKLGNRPIDSIKRSEIVRLLDDVEENNGAFRAQAVLAILSKLFNWHASRDDDFLSPIRRGMARVKLKEYARDRVLFDHELRAIWRAAETLPGPYGHLVRFLLLTATRRGEAAEMVRKELAGDDWIIPASRMKAKQEHVVPLSAAARAIVHSMPRQGEHVFTLNGRGAINNFADDKVRLDEASGVTGWRLHDLRRTARSLMSRAGVDSDHAERCLAHVIGGVRGVYDRYAYHKEKKHAFEILATQIERIVYPPADVIVPIRRQG
jgi:integrase